jgi:hypothetical protein
MNEKSEDRNHLSGENHNKQNSGSAIGRRKFIGGMSAAALGISLVPRQVLGGRGFVAPSDKINMAYIGCGTQCHREMVG